MSNPAAWLLAARPKTLAAGIAPVLAGSALAADAGSLRPGVAVACLLVCMLLQLGVNFINDWADGLRGTDGSGRLGPARMVASGRISPEAMLAASCLVLVAALGVGLWLAWLGGWPILVLGLISIASAWAYTAGPFPLAYHGLGDLFVLVFFGLVAVLGTAWVQVAGSTLAGPLLLGLPWWWWLVAAALGLQATAVLTINNLRDIEGDARHAKRTICVRLGPARARAYHAMLHGVAGALLGAVAGSVRWSLALPALCAFALGIFLSMAVSRAAAAGDANTLNRCLGRAAGVEAATALLIALALWMERP